MNLRLLRLFDEVARYRSFSRAAEVLHISQPAVSKGVRALEEQLGAALLERSPSGIRPTQAGEILVRHARAIFVAERRAEEELAAMNSLESGLLRVGASTTIGTYLLPPLLGAFHRAHPGIELQLSSANTHAIAEMLVAWELDIALVEGPVVGLPVVATPWREEALALIAAPQHPIAALEQPIDPALLGEQLMLVREPGSGTREVVAAALAERGLVPRSTIELGSTEAIKQLVMAGVGIAIVSAAAARDQVALGRLCTIAMRDFVPRRTLTRLSLPDRLATPAVVAFGRLLDFGEPGKARSRPADGSSQSFDI